MRKETLPQRVFNSPAIEFVNFEEFEGSHINLIRLIKPYANGNSYAIHNTTTIGFNQSGLFKTYKRAKTEFDFLVEKASIKCRLRNRGLTNNRIAIEFTPEEAEKMYLDYFNNYLTVKKFASDKCLTESIADQIIDKGKKFNHLSSPIKTIYYSHCCGKYITRLTKFTNGKYVKFGEYFCSRCKNVTTKQGKEKRF